MLEYAPMLEYAHIIPKIMLA